MKMMLSSMAKGPIHYIVKYQVGSWDDLPLGCFLCRDFHWEMSGIICCLATSLHVPLSCCLVTVFTLIPKEALKGLPVSRLCPAKSRRGNILKLPVSVFQGDLTGWIPNRFCKNLGNFVLR